ncbi:MAG: hypothetical protein J5887_04875 [Erysipelotrichaceae bacterium]|nr:hypothetical protein [Erysipelotrichaceae bacterium]
MKKLLSAIYGTWKKIVKALFHFGYVTPLSPRETMLLSERKIEDDQTARYE